jgi:DNA damage-binding protein 1
LGIISPIQKSLFELFLDLQNTLTKIIKGIGNFTHENFRAYKTPSKLLSSTNFIDGDLIESFLDLPNDIMNIIIQNMKTKITLNDAIKNIEDYSKSLH